METKTLDRDEKIAKVIREGHEIAEEIKRAKNLEELGAIGAKAKAFKEYVNSEFGMKKTYEPYFEGKDKFSQLNITPLSLTSKVG